MSLLQLLALGVALWVLLSIPFALVFAWVLKDEPEERPYDHTFQITGRDQ